MAGFKIPSIPPTTNKTIRFPNDVIEEVERALWGRTVPFPLLSLQPSGLPWRS